MLPNEARVFSTKERCPVLMCFDNEIEEDETDVAEYLHDQFGDGPKYGPSDSFEDGQQPKTPPTKSTPSNGIKRSEDMADISLGETMKQMVPTKVANAASKAKKKGLGAIMKEASKNMSKALGTSSPRRRNTRDNTYKPRGGGGAKRGAKRRATAGATRQQKHYTAFLHNDGILGRSDNSIPIRLFKKSSSTLPSLCSLHIPPSYISNNLPLVASLLASPLIPTPYAIHFAHRSLAQEPIQQEQASNLEGGGERKI